MADETPAPQPSQAAPAPAISILAQYVSDLSFENPNAPASVMPSTVAPNFNLQINVGVKKQTDEVYAVELTLTARGERESQLLFNVEMVYGGVFRIRNVPEAQIGPWLAIECPRLIFPFARQALANVVQSGGFPPLLMDPVDFAGLYRQNVERMAAQQAAPGKAN